MHTGWRYLSQEQDNSGVTATIDTPSGRTTRRARYLVGCDGASSPVRSEVGGGMIDFQFDEPWLVIDARVLPGARTPEINLQICDPKRPTTCVLMGPGRHRWEFMLLPGETPDQVLDDDFIQSLITPWDCGPVELERKAVYRFHGLMANRWRNGRVLLAGDSAHQMPPFAGQGMCSGLRDAANLAWKLQAVLAGAPEALLDTYQTERAPHVRAIIEQAIGMGRVVCTLDPVAAAERDRGMLAQEAGGARPLPPARAASLTSGCVLDGTTGAGALFPQPTTEGQRLDDVLHDGAWLLSRTTWPGASDIATVMTLEDASLAPFRKALTDWLDREGADAVLVRPDRYVFGTGDPSVLAAAYARHVTDETTPAPHGR
jgi:3-(3-hydroxy-phenyl)propionate hydroxylase